MLREKLLVAIMGAAIITAVTGCGIGVIAGCSEDNVWQANQSETSPTVVLQEATVVKVVDGDTIVVSINKNEQKVRLIGVDTPESVHPDKERNTEAGKEASAFTEELIPEGTIIWLEKDTSETDQYGRLLRYVWLEKPSDANNSEEATEKMLNARLVADGMAVAKTYEPDTKWASLFESLQS